MGTLCLPLPPNVRDYFLNKVLVWSPESRGTYKVLDLKIVALSEVYAAVERIDKETGEREVFAFVSAISFNRSYYGFCHKDMDESMGPYQDRCPLSILNLLTPTTSEYAQQWRERCRAYHARPKPAEILIDGVVKKTYAKWKLANKAAFKIAREQRDSKVVLRHVPTNEAWEVHPWGGYTKLAAT